MGTARETNDRAIDHIVWSELKLAVILGVQRVDAEVADRIREVLGRLDAALTEIRRPNLDGRVEDGDPRPDPNLRVPAAVPEPRLHAVPR